MSIELTEVELDGQALFGAWAALAAIGSFQYPAKIVLRIRRLHRALKPEVEARREAAQSIMKAHGAEVGMTGDVATDDRGQPLYGEEQSRDRAQKELDALDAESFTCNIVPLKFTEVLKDDGPELSASLILTLEEAGVLINDMEEELEQDEAEESQVDVADLAPDQVGEAA